MVWLPFNLTNPCLQTYLLVHTQQPSHAAHSHSALTPPNASHTPSLRVGGFRFWTCLNSIIWCMLTNVLHAMLFACQHFWMPSVGQSALREQCLHWWICISWVSCKCKHMLACKQAYTYTEFNRVHSDKQRHRTETQNRHTDRQTCTQRDKQTDSAVCVWASMVLCVGRSVGRWVGTYVGT